MLKPSECLPCVLCRWKTPQGRVLQHLGTGFTRPDGTATLGVAICGESAGHAEAVDGLPFRPKAQAGSMLKRCLELARSMYNMPQIVRENFLVYNILQCQPPKNELAYTWYEDHAIASCKVHRDKVLDFSPVNDHIKQRVILALGNIATRVLTGYSGSAAEKQSVTNLRGFVLDSPYPGILVVPGIHPSALKRGNAEQIPLLVADIVRSVQVANGSYTKYIQHPSYEAPNFIEFPSLDDLDSFEFWLRDNQQVNLGVDIETPYTDTDEDERGEEFIQEGVNTIQFSTGKGHGIIVKWDNTSLPTIKRILALGNTKLGHNWWFFDEPVIRKNGIDQINGYVHDIMWMFKQAYPELPRGLQAVASMAGYFRPWKHLFGSATYGCIDVEVLHWILPWLVGEMKRKGVLGQPGIIKDKRIVQTIKGYKGQVYVIHGIMKRTSARGIPVDENERVQLKEHLSAKRASMEKELDNLIPMELRNISPKRKIVTDAADTDIILDDSPVPANTVVQGGVYEDEIEIPDL